MFFPRERAGLHTMRHTNHAPGLRVRREKIP